MSASWIPTHDQPTPYQPGELAVVNVSDAKMNFIRPSTVSAGSVRGCVVSLHGLNSGLYGDPADGSFFGLQSYMKTLCDQLTADGFHVIQPQQLGDNQVQGLPHQEVSWAPCIELDRGATFLRNLMNWWDKVVDYVRLKYGPMPIIPWGFSDGAYTALAIAKLRPKSVVAVGSHHPATIWGDLTAFPEILGSDTSSMDLDTHWLDTFDPAKPIMMSAGTMDTSVGYTLVGAGSAFPNNQVGTDLPSSNFLEIYKNALSHGVDVWLQLNSSFHDMRQDETSPTSAPFSTTVTGSGGALSSITSLSVGDNSGLVIANPTSNVNIVASDGLHVVKFTGKAGSTGITGVSFNGDQTATIATGAIVSNCPSWLYWFAQKVYPLCPAKY